MQLPGWLRCRFAKVEQGKGANDGKRRNKTFFHGSH